MTDVGELVAGRYRLVSQLGLGAMGVVWRAHDERLLRTVAVKQLLEHPGAGTAGVRDGSSGLSQARARAEANRSSLRMIREGRIAAQLHHPHAITIYDVAEHEGNLCLIMEYLPSRSLGQMLATTGPLPPTEVARIGEQIAAALAAAHQAGIVHRDIKPANVLIADDGTAKITDFGISRTIGDSRDIVTASGILAGTPAYLAPEVAKGEDASFVADVFALGATLYTAVEGTPPFGLDDNPLALLYRIATREITPPSQAGPLTSVLVRMLELDPARRPTMHEAHKALQTVATEETVSATTSTAAASASAFASATTGEVGLRQRPHRKPATRTGTGHVGRPRVNVSTVIPTAVPTALIRAATALPRVARSLRRPSTKLPRMANSLMVAAVSMLVSGVLLVATLGSESRSTADRATEAPQAAPDTPGPQVPPPPPEPSQPSQPSQLSQPARQPEPPLGTASATPAAPDARSTPSRAPGGYGDPAPDDPRTALVDYYALMPTDLETGWTLLTSDYQTNHAGGFGGYRAFWAPVQRLGIADVAVTAPGEARATITYFFQDGRIVVESTSFGLVIEDGIWKIASSAVRSSRTTST